MTIQIDLPKDVEARLRAQVNAGRHVSIAEAILEKVSRDEDPDLLAMIGRQPAWLQRDLEAAWLDRDGAVDGETFFARLAERSASLKPGEK